MANTQQVELPRSARGRENMPIWLTGSTVALGGLVALAVSLSQANGSVAAGLMWWLYMLGALFVGAALGLIFGVPRARTEYKSEATERYTANSNLEQISDWLTKILVGAGLVELKALPDGLIQAGQFMGSDLGVVNPTAFAASSLVYGLGAGFGIGYLWTRLRLRLHLEQSDREAVLAARVDAITSSLGSAPTEAGGPTESPASIRNAVRSAITTVDSTDPTELLPVLWVDDNPGNNAGIVSSLTALRIRVDLATTTKQGLEKAARSTYGVVITDMGRNEEGGYNADAGVDLIRGLRSSGNSVPIIIFSTRETMERRDRLTADGATLVTNRAGELLQHAVSFASRGRQGTP